jgi:hypothetical protein
MRGCIGTAIVGFFLRSYLGSYLTEKGKNLATFEDIQKLVAQVQATEEAKADISSRMWDRQMRWAGKKERYEKLTADLSTLSSLMTHYESEKRNGIKQGDEFKRILDHGEVISRNAKVTRLFAGNDVNVAYRRVIAAFSVAVDCIERHCGGTECKDAVESFADAEDAFIVAAKKDLGYTD